MKAAVSPPSDGLFEVDGGEVQSKFKSMQKRSQEDLKFVKTNPGAQKLNTSFSLSEIQWIRHFAPNISGKEVNIRANRQVVDSPSSYSSKSVKRERCCYSKEYTSQAQPSSSSQNGDGCGEVSDQNFIKEDITGAESRQSYKKKRLSSPVPPSFIKQAAGGSKTPSQRERPRTRQHGISQQKRQEIREAFDLFDTDGSDTLLPCLHNYAFFFHRALGFEMTEQQIQQMIADVDKDGSGAIELEEFVQMMTAKIGERDTKEELLKAFSLIDQDKNEKISVEDIQRIAKDLGETFTIDEIKEMVQEADQNEDGEVDQDEFMRIMKRTSYAY
ncbi:caltractin [Carex littledalei]|uniref:Caltractin n=1 Tax=Carex littledalei TaxID=544730 RepID=A0A833QR20_9POAL|nr:caltractin [Carex littledalei]